MTDGQIKAVSYMRKVADEKGIDHSHITDEEILKMGESLCQIAEGINQVVSSILAESRQVSVKIKKLHPNAVIPKYARELDAGFDLVAVEDTLIAPGESVKVRTGLAMALPPGYELQVRPRSGVGANTKLRISNSPGTVDAGYRGEICVLVDNIYQPEYKIVMDPEHGQDFIAPHGGHVFDLSGNDYLAFEYGEQIHGTHIIRKGDRIAQGVLAAVPIAQFEVVDELDDTERGNGGFGHTGITA